MTKLLPLALLVACTDAPEAPPIDLSDVPYTLRRDGGEVLDVYLTAPGVSQETGVDPILDDALAALIDAATTSVDLALFEFDRQVIIDAVIAAHQRGVAVRFVGDEDELGDHGYVALVEAGVPMVNRPARNRIMHDKFVVVDGQVVWTGSTNMSENGVLRNNNHSVLIENASLAAQFQVEFDQMYAQGRFGPQKDDLHGFSTVPFRGVDLEFYFSPQHDPIHRLVEEVATAERSIHFLVFSYTHADLVAAMQAAKDRGVEVVGVFDEDQARGRYSVDEALAMAGFPVFIDGNGHNVGFSGGKLHHKLLVIDAAGNDPRVVTGSFNWSQAATDYNDENVLVIRDPALTRVMAREFCDRLAEATLHPEYRGEVPDPCRDPRSQVFVNELLPNPAGTDRGQEYVEIVNGSDVTVDLSGWTLGDASDPVRHTFSGTVLGPGEVVVVFDTGEHAEPHAIVSSTGTLSLNNTGDRITLADPEGAPVDVVEYGTAADGVAFNRATDGVRDEQWVRHDALGALPSSPGTRADGTPFGEAAPPEFTVIVNEVLPNPAGTDLGQEYVEIVNLGPDDADLGGWRLGDLADPARHVFGSTTLPAGHALVIYDRGDHSDVPNAILASSTQLSLNNTGETVTLLDAGGAVRDSVSWSTSRDGIALVRSPDGVAGAPLVDHDSVAASPASPGTRSDGSAFE